MFWTARKLLKHESILEQYKLDFTQCEAENKKLLLTNIYELLPAELNEKTKDLNLQIWIEIFDLNGWRIVLVGCGKRMWLCRYLMLQNLPFR